MSDRSERGIGERRDDLDFPEEIGILPVRNTILYPGLIIPLAVGRSGSVRLLEEVNKEDSFIGILTQKDPAEDNPREDDLYHVGTVARIIKTVKLAQDNYNVVIQGLARFRATKFIQYDPYMKVQMQVLKEDAPGDVETEALAINLKATAKEVIKHMPNVPDEAASMIEGLTDPGQMTDLIAANMEISIAERQEILETVGLNARMKLVLRHLTHRLEVLKLSQKISSQVKGEMNKTQREYFLRQQLKAIREELGELDEDDEGLDEFEQLAKKIEESNMPEEVEKTARKELKRLKTIQPSSAEYTVARTYLDWMTTLPWQRLSKDNLDTKNVREVLDQDHYDLDKVKKRIVEYLAVRRLKDDMKGPILCFVGPPGVGKTSLGKSIARAIGREFVRISLGGVHDEAEIRGHRRTYVGALPGRIIQGMKKANVRNPVFMLDEIDKLGRDFRGDPASALLEVLDPEQNNSFSDHYLEVPFDLSKVLFIATANQLDPVPPALRDRMEVIELPGYTREEKLFIAKKFLLPKQLQEHGLTDTFLKFGDEAVYSIIDSYTREAGVRNLERRVADVCRSQAVEFAEGKTEPKTIAEKDLAAVLGPERFFSEVAERTGVPGVSTGLAWTPTGGDLIFIEASRMKGKGTLTLTGQLGDVMKESAQAALSFIRSNAKMYGISEDFLKEQDLHVHIPAGAIPKDGPSAGVTLFTALVSLLSNVKVRHDVAMTGEITLRGKVLAIGGLKEKTLAAHRAGIRRIILPERNRKDLVDIPERTRDEMEFLFAQEVNDVLYYALLNPPASMKLKKPKVDPVRPVPRPPGAGDGDGDGAKSKRKEKKPAEIRAAN
jgi:ATP-dependent Lon protease